MQSIYEEEILELIASAWDGMTKDQRVHWEAIKIAPEKWVQKQSLPIEYLKEPIGIDRDEFDDEDMEGGAFDDGDGGFDEYSTDASDSEFEEDLDQEVDDGFWVVAVIGSKVLWYNHVEQGFNVSPFSTCGCIDKYESRKDDFDIAFKKVMPV
ncbi:hypothetical protein A9Q81_03945 [Gammaproteobacteria bacterium 42_54_T18]|nr:hypothetical protein A9Q81_03945 [Gammaproteobacteria bacterium 42_54_T18]